MLSEERSVLWSYISQLQSYHEYNIDNPLYKSFVNGATDTISRIRLENLLMNNFPLIKIYCYLMTHISGIILMMVQKDFIREK